MEEWKYAIFATLSNRGFYSLEMIVFYLERYKTLSLGLC